VQTLHVLNQRQIYELDSGARNRITASTTFCFLGGAAGSGLAALAWSAWGWSGVCAVGVATATVATAVWVADTMHPRPLTLMDKGCRAQLRPQMGTVMLSEAQAPSDSWG
jgi:hypothetical protein